MTIVTHEPLRGVVQALQEAWTQLGITSIICEFIDQAGMPRSKVIPTSRLANVAIDGQRMIGVMVTTDSATNLVDDTLYGAERRFGDCILKPDLTTLSLVPWQPHTARVICDLYWLDGSPQSAAPREVLKRVLARLSKYGLTPKVAIESEFYLFHSAELVEEVLLNGQDKAKGVSLPTPVFESVHIFSTELNMQTPLHASLFDWLPRIGIEPRTWNTEYGTGQFELTIKEQPGLTSADQAYTFRQAVRAAARNEALHATFMTKPFPGHASASGSHVHISLWDEYERNVMVPHGGTQDHYGLSEQALHFAAGIIKHAPAVQALAAPTPNCYDRFHEGSFAPTRLTLGIDDRTSLVRGYPTDSIGTHIESRQGSGLANPYLLIAATLGAGLLGLEEKVLPLAPIEGLAEQNTEAEYLPTSLQAALQAFQQDTALRTLLGEEFTTIYTKIKELELARQEAFVSEVSGKDAITEEERSEAERKWQLREYFPHF